MKRRYRMHVKKNPDGSLYWRMARVFDTGRKYTTVWYDDSAAAVYAVLFYGL